MKFIECPLCHASLDFGEKCDCESKHEDDTERFEYIDLEKERQVTKGKIEYI